MVSWCALLLMAALAAGQERPKLGPPKPEPAQGPQEEPPEEDEGNKPKEYVFNPLQAAKELQTGNFYFKKGSYKAAANRFLEATRWNPTLADAFLRLGETQERLHDRKSARESYKKFLELAPDSKLAPDIRKRVGK